MFLRSHALALTPSELAGGESLPLPGPKGRAFPFLLALDGYPTASADVAHEQEGLLEELGKLL